MIPMNTYYLHDGTVLSGPFTLDELKAKKITKTTSVWCEGMEDGILQDQSRVKENIIFNTSTN
jgi:hypothetical protein